MPVWLLLVACPRPDEETPPPEDEPLSWHFTDATVGSGLEGFHHEPFNLRGSFDAYDHGNGLAAGDFDGDGHEDLLALTQCGPTGYFLGHGDGTFTDRSDLLPPLEDGVRVSASYGDYDQDGDIDFYLTYTRRPNALLRQNEDGSFTDVAVEAGVALVGHWTGATLFDADGDSDLDLAVASNLYFTFDDPPLPADDRCPAGFKGMNLNDIVETSVWEGVRLLINQGGVFTDETEARGLPTGSSDPAVVRGLGDVLAFDFDRDRDLDLFFPEMFAARPLLAQNDGTGHFTDVTALWIPRPSYGAVGATAADFDGDGWPDLLESDMHSDMWISFVWNFSDVDTDVRYLDHHGPLGLGVGDNPTGPLFGNTLWLSGDSERWQESALAWKAETFNPWGGLAADFDQDRDTDLFIPSGMSNPFEYFPSVLLDNRGSSFEEVQLEAGLTPPPWGKTDPNTLVMGAPLVTSLRGSALADFDEDGDQDIAAISWHDGVRLLRVDGPEDQHWLGVKLHESAEVELVAGESHQVRWTESSRGYLSQSSPIVHFGLGELDQVDQVIVRWLDGSETVVEAPAAEAVLEIVR